MLVMDTIGLYLLAASLVWSLFLPPRGQIPYALCIFLAATIGSEMGDVGEDRQRAAIVAVFLLWLIGAACLTHPQWEVPPPLDLGSGRS